jgi:hypothetical protein
VRKGHFDASPLVAIGSQIADLDTAELWSIAPKDENVIIRFDAF